MLQPPNDLNSAVIFHQLDAHDHSSGRWLQGNDDQPSLTKTNVPAVILGPEFLQLLMCCLQRGCRQMSG